MCASWPTTLASLTRPGLQRAQMLGILGDAKVITVPIALTHVCLPNLWSQGRLTHCNSALFAQSVKSDLGVPWRRASWRVSGSEIWSKDWYEVGLFVLAILLCSGSVSTKAKANHSQETHARLTKESRLVCGSHGC